MFLFIYMFPAFVCFRQQGLELMEAVMVSHVFGDQRTEKKLKLVHEYANLYVTVLSSAKFSPVKHYIDCCSGTGEVTLKDGQTIDGSAIRMAQ